MSDGDPFKVESDLWDPLKYMDFNTNPGCPRVLEAGWLAGGFLFLSLSDSLRTSADLRAELPPPIETKDSRCLELGYLKLGIDPCCLQSSRSWRDLQDWKV